MFRSILRAIASTTVALVAVAAIASTAAAGPRADDAGGRIGVGALTNEPVRPDDRADRTPGVFFDVREHVAPGHRFRWDDAAVGAAASLGALLVTGIAALSIRRRARLAH